MNKYFNLMFLIVLLSCNNDNRICDQFKDEIYTNLKIEPNFLEEQYKYINYLYYKFKTKQIDTTAKEAYHIIFYSMHGFGKEINFVKLNHSYILRMNSIQKEGFTNYNDNYSIKLQKEDWDKLIDVIYEFDFWTEETQQKQSKSVLDGFVIYVAGYRSEARKCNKRYKHFILKGNPEYDKIESLVKSVMDLEERLQFKYHQN